MLPLVMFPVIARSEATKQSRSATTYVTNHKPDEIASLRSQ
jgi:hypothetical protein